MRAQDPITRLSGIGPARAALFEKLGVVTLSDLLLLLPQSFRVNEIKSLSASNPEALCMLRLTVCTAPRVSFFAGGKRAVRFCATDDSGKAELIFFYQTYLSGRFEVGKPYYFYGRVKRSGDKFLLYSPEFEDAASPLPPLSPRYPTTAGLSQRAIAAAIAQILPLAESLVEDPLPPSVLRACALCGKAEALRLMHTPESLEDAERGRRRLAFEELFLFRLDILLLQQKRGIPQVSPLHAVSFAPLFKAFGFTPTESQNEAAAEIAADLIGDGGGGKLPAMHRLLQGDVGSGKTAVAAAALYLALKNRKKAALMAPTELLARQHAQKLSPIFGGFGFETLVLTGSTSKSERARIDARLSEDAPCLLIGTHALLTERIKIKELCLTVVDEQHRFGVRQRDALLSKAAEKNLLTMSATPIPRTLALFLFSKEDISTLTTLPPGRSPVETYYVGEDKRARVCDFIRRQLDCGGRAYLVCPAIEESEQGDLMAAQSRFAAAQKEFAPYQVGFLHGKLSAAQKNAAMRAFAEGETQVLVCTTVIEIGIDVPQASVMCVENAERFGLATLHQLRGRVGRGSLKSTCILMSDSTSRSARERLRMLCKTTDGFALAEYDMKNRGPGDFFGLAQSGRLAFGAARDADEALLSAAAKAAEDFFESGAAGGNGVAVTE